MKKFFIQLISVVFLLSTCLTYISAQDTLPKKDKNKKEQVKKDNKRPAQKKEASKKNDKSKKSSKKNDKSKHSKGKAVAKGHDKKAQPKGKKQQEAAPADSVQ